MSQLLTNSKLQAAILAINGCFELLWGVIFLLFPVVVQSLVYAPLPAPLIRVVAAAPLSIALLSFWMSKAARHSSTPLQAGYWTLALFNIVLAITLAMAWQAKLAPWYGWLLHLPFLLYFCFMSSKYRRTLGSS